MKEQLISERLTLDPGAPALLPTVPGEPVLTKRFMWRGIPYEIAEVLETWKEAGPSLEGPQEHYLRRHWYRVRTTDGLEMKIYFERQPRSRGQRKARWWLYSVTSDE